MKKHRDSNPWLRYATSVACLCALAGCGKTATPPVAPAAATLPAKVSAASSVAHAKPLPASSVSESASAPAPAATRSSPANTAAGIEVVQLTLGTAVDAAHRITAAGTRFSASEKMIYASVATRGHTAEAVLNARWRYLEGRGQLISSISQSIASDGPATTTFTLQNPDLWPEGKYRIEISLDGVPVIQRDFEIANP